MQMMRLSGAVLGLLASTNALFYLPGVAPRSYARREQVKLYVNKLTSTHTQIPYDYYSLPYCHPKVHQEKENLGERLSGDRIENSLYKLEAKVPQACEIVCRKWVNKHAAKAFAQAIDDDYRVHWIVDALPAAIVVVNEVNPSEPYYARGFPVGFKALSHDLGGSIEPGKPHKPFKFEHYLYNHIRIIVSYNEDKNDDPEARKFEGLRIVGVRVEPFSINHRYDSTHVFDIAETTLDTCNEMQSAANDPANYQSIDQATEVIFSYDIAWEETDTPWANRWDVYLKGNPDDKIHWFSITNSTMIVIFLTVMVGMILVRTLSKDIAQYNEVGGAASLEEAREESGWKLVHADVFRPPQTCPMLYAVLVGAGTQLCLMLGATLSFALLGFLSPANRGSLITAFILLFVFMASFAGYHSACTYKLFRGTRWKDCTLATALAYPGVVFVVFLVLDLALLAEGSSGAVPASTIATLCALWLGVSTPLVFVGSYFGFKKDVEAHPVRTNQIPRQVPPQPWYMHPALTITFGGILPFGAVSVELFFVMSALWLHQIYYIFGFLFLVTVILVVTCAEITILMCYFQLCNEDYRWWWRAFLSSGACAGYIFCYSVWYYATELDITGFVPSCLYFGYMFLVALTFFLITGSVGYFSCFWFVTKIYGSIKVD